MNKEELKNYMLSMESNDLDTSYEKYEDYLDQNLAFRNEAYEIDDLSQKDASSELSDEYDSRVNSGMDNKALLESIDFGPKTEIESGAVAKINGQYWVIAVPTPKFDYQGTTYMGISADSPIYKKIEGKKAGDTGDYNGVNFTVEEVC